MLALILKYYDSVAREIYVFVMWHDWGKMVFGHGMRYKMSGHVISNLYAYLLCPLMHQPASRGPLNSYDSFSVPFRTCSCEFFRCASAARPVYSGCYEARIFNCQRQIHSEQPYLSGRLSHIHRLCSFHNDSTMTVQRLWNISALVSFEQENILLKCLLLILQINTANQRTALPIIA